MKAAPWLSIVGLGEDGVEGLTPAATRLIEAAATVFGGSRHLALVAPLLRGEVIAWLSPLDATIPLIQARRGTPTCVLASGDPFHYGIGATLARHLGPEDFVCLPQPSAFSLAAARLGWALQDTVCLSLHGRALERVIPELRPGVRLLALSWDGSTPRSLAVLLAARGFGASILHVCEALGGPRERIGAHVAATFDLSDVADLNILGLEVRAEGRARARPLTAGLPDDWFEHDGQITKAPIRAVTVSALAPHPGETLWDIGAGSGSIGIEWLLCHGSMRAIAVERHAARAARIGRNAAEWGVAERLVVQEGRAPDCLRDLSAPDAIFVGGGATADGLLDLCRDALSPGGRLVVNAVTIETQALLAQVYRDCGGDLFTLGVAQAEPIGAFHGLRPAMPVMQWRWSKS